MSSLSWCSAFAAKRPAAGAIKGQACAHNNSASEPAVSLSPASERGSLQPLDARLDSARPLDAWGAL